METRQSPAGCNEDHSRAGIAHAVSQEPGQAALPIGHMLCAALYSLQPREALSHSSAMLNHCKAESSMRWHSDRKTSAVCIKAVWATHL